MKFINRHSHRIAQLAPMYEIKYQMQSNLKILTQKYSTIKIAEPLNISDINQRTIEAKYAVRGKIPIKAEELKSIIKLDPNHKLPFTEIINANIGNPQQLDQQPLTWYRQVLSILQYPDILNLSEASKIYPSDVIERAKILISHIGSIGAYSHSQGDPYIRSSIAKFITNRDGYISSADNVFLTNGASSAVLTLLQILSCGKNTGFLIPIPQYPLYTATISLNDAIPIGYYLNEENHWSTDPNEIKQLLKENLRNDINVKALVIINPGNPTGAILNRQDIIEIINITAEYGVVLIADEVYQENIFKGSFLSTKKVLSELLEYEPEIYKNVQLVSLHSTSKGVSGECGQRGGYMELVGFKPEVKDVILKLASINLCPVVTGQALMELMINPPKKDAPSYDLYYKETRKIHDDLESRANLLHQAFIKMVDISCNKPMGAMYLFPRLNFIQENYSKLFDLSKTENLSIDEIYCIELLEKTGICCVPGNGFGQRSNTYHLRTTFLSPGKEWIDRWLIFHENFVNLYHN